MMRRTLASVLGLTRLPPLMTRETVVVPTPARRATSVRVGCEESVFFIGRSAQPVYAMALNERGLSVRGRLTLITCSGLRGRDGYGGRGLPSAAVLSGSGG